ncbi:HI0074 family nucleotidyltransferase substrate-binding subunit [Nitrosomonas sp.]|uniref:HI0074 family nucleotidyltransferase substrate-binding subunit n=1 Tax=Nitrosomonas sp. TaxID=42353 RepID=UPI00261B56F6|nr:HI0074 family nucleotidyltransferase substrate-binding subunit [Nitrosomonas sp.]
MDIQRFTERADTFVRAAARLTEACEQPFNSFIRDSVIQRFEFCWELAWKILKLRLEMVGIEVLTPRDVFQESLSKGLIRDGNAWSEAQKMRNLTSHTYDEKLADTVYNFLVNQGQLLFKELAQDVATWRKEIH